MKSSKGNFSYDDSEFANKPRILFGGITLGYYNGCSMVLSKNGYLLAVTITPSDLRELADFLEQIQEKDAAGAQS